MTIVRINEDELVDEEDVTSDRTLITRNAGEASVKHLSSEHRIV